MGFVERVSSQELISLLNAEKLEEVDCISKQVRTCFRSAHLFMSTVLTTKRLFDLLHRSDTGRFDLVSKCWGTRQDLSSG